MSQPIFPDTQALYETMSLGVVFHDEKLRIVAANEAAGEILGVDQEQLIGRAPCDSDWKATRRDGGSFPGEEHPASVAFNTHQRVGRTLMGVYNPQLGKNRWIAVRAAPLFHDGERQPYGAFSTFADVTDLERMEESEERHRTLFQKNLALMLLIHPESGRVLDANPAACTFYGYPREELTRLSIWDINTLPPDQVKEEMRQARSEKRKLFYFNHRLASGEIREVQVYSSPVQWSDTMVLHSIIHDITDHAHTQAELELTNRELTLLNRLIEVGSSEISTEEVLVVACAEIQRALGVDRAAVYLLDPHTGRFSLKAFYRDESKSPLPVDVHQFALNQGARERLSASAGLSIFSDLEQPSDIPPKIRQTLLSYGVRAATVVPLTRRQELLGFFTLASDDPTTLTHRQENLLKKVAYQLATSICRRRMAREQRLLQAAMEQTTEGLVITDTEGRILYVNPAFEKMTGYCSEEVWDENPRILQSGKHDDAFYRKLWDTISSGRVWKGRLRNKRKSGEEYVEDALIAPVQDKRGVTTHYLGLKRDITQDLERETQLRQSQKLESIGRLAGGIAHDFNNHLATILTGAALVQSGLKESDPAFEDILAIRETTHRASDLVRQLLAFASRGSAELQKTDLNRLIMDLRQVFRRLIGADIELVILPEPNLPAVRVDRTQVEQVLFNLVANARDAMPSGGKLTLTTHLTVNPVCTEDRFEGFQDIPAGRYVVLTATDTGIGMSEEVREKIFDPFFTTKSRGQGTGLGLASTFGIIRQAGGYIKVDSEPGEGTSFTLILAAVETEAEENEEKAAAIRCRRGHERVLLADDEHSFRSFTSRILDRMGYTVRQAQDGKEALRLWEACEDELGGPGFDVLVSDVFMPHMGGYELAGELLQRHPKLCVVLISGYSDPPHKALSKMGEFIEHLAKPFAPEDLVETMRRLLDQASPPPKP